MARLAKTAYPLEVRWGEEKDIEKVLAYEEGVWRRLAASSAALKEGEVVGAFVTFPVADGKACYLVIKEEPLTLQHVPLGDGYQVAPAHIRGLRRTDVLELARRERAVAALFSGAGRGGA